MKTDKSDTPVVELKSTELVEANELTRLREAHIRFAQLRTFGPLSKDNRRKVAETPWMLKLGALPNGTTRTKLSKGVVLDMVAVPYHLAETTKDGKPFYVVTLNERLGLEKTAIEGRLPKPLDPVEATKRLVGPIMFAIAEMTFPRERNKAGALAITPDCLNMLKACGFNNWREPNGIAASFIETISTEITMPVDAFEIAKVANTRAKTKRVVLIPRIKTDEGSKPLTRNGKAVQFPTPKWFKDEYSSKLHELTFELAEIDLTEQRKADEIAEQISRDKDTEADEAAKQAALDKLAKDTEEALSLI